MKQSDKSVNDPKDSADHPEHEEHVAPMEPEDEPTERRLEKILPAEIRDRGELLGNYPIGTSELPEVGPSAPPHHAVTLTVAMSRFIAIVTTKVGGVLMRDVTDEYDYQILRTVANDVNAEVARVEIYRVLKSVFITHVAH